MRGTQCLIQPPKLGRDGQEMSGHIIFSRMLVPHDCFRKFNVRQKEVLVVHGMLHVTQIFRGKLGSLGGSFPLYPPLDETLVVLLNYTFFI